LYVNSGPVYSGAPVNTPNVNYGTVAADNGKILLHTSGAAHTYTIEDAVMPVGSLITFTNLGGTLTIQNTATSMWLSPSGTTGNRSLAQYGTATVQKVESGGWLISGSGIS